MTSVLPRRRAREGIHLRRTSWSMSSSISRCEIGSTVIVGRPHHRGADHAEAHQELLVQVVEEIAPLRAEAVAPP